MTFYPKTSLPALTIPENSYVLVLIRLVLVDNGPNTQIDANVRYFLTNIETSSCVTKMHSITLYHCIEDR